VTDIATRLPIGTPIADDGLLDPEGGLGTVGAQDDQPGRVSARVLHHHHKRLSGSSAERENEAGDVAAPEASSSALDTATLAPHPRRSVANRGLARTRGLRSRHHGRPHARHRVAEAEHALDEGSVILRLDGILRLRGLHPGEPRAANRAGSSTDASTAATADRPAEPGPERGRQRRYAEPAQIGAPRLVAYCLLRELPANSLIVLKVRE
jgi:hypothetical protein